MEKIIIDYPQFFTATNLEWYPALRCTASKEIVLAGLKFLVAARRINLHAFVIMSNHLHLIWQMCGGYNREEVQRDFLRVSGQKLKKHFARYEPGFLKQFYVGAKDRNYQLWERNPFSIELSSHKVYLQKLNYLHENPVKAGICTYAEEYKYSSARFYETGVDEWGFLYHYRG